MFQNALYNYLNNHSKGKKYVGKLLEIMPMVEDYLAYTSATFPHYTRHTINHSKTIVDELSLLLFPPEKNGKGKPVINLSAVEVYLLICAALFHDAGMVTSEKEKIEILGSEEWKNWIKEGRGEQLYSKLETFRENPPDASNILKNNFVYNWQLRLVIAEYVRQKHHLRSGSLIEMSATQMGGLDFSDPALRIALSNICVAHGLDFSELKDNSRFPDIQTIQGEQVNVKLLAMLFRIGDLLDMSHDRTCGLLELAAAPLPEESKAHWTQYKRFIKRTTSPIEISISAECMNHEEHAVIQDWCSWLQKERDNIAAVIPNMRLHNKWNLPDVKIDVRPNTAKGATYINENWKFQFDEDNIVTRLVNDVHSSHLGYLYELVQNALDATRCRLYEELKRQGLPTPQNPWQVEQKIRNQFPISIEVAEEKSTPDGPLKTVITIDDHGIGMDKNVIKNFFLQMGKSFYTSKNFHSNFSFNPISRYGIGFLSVFAVSNRVEVITYKDGNEPLKLTLRGIRNYLLVDKSSKANVGTTIKVYLETKPEEDIEDYIKSICKYVEFPLRLKIMSKEKIISVERPKDLTYTMDDNNKSGNKFELRSFPILTEGLYGALYTLVYHTPKGEDWTKMNYAKHRYPKANKVVQLPKIPNNIYAFNGLTNDDYFGRGADDNKICRIDVRSKVQINSLEKRGIRRPSLRMKQGWERELDKIWENILLEHLEVKKTTLSRDEYWKYMQGFPDSYWLDSFWENLEGCIRIQYKNQTQFLSLEEFKAIKEFNAYYTTNSAGITEEIKDEGFWFKVTQEDEHTQFFKERIYENFLPALIQKLKPNSYKITWKFDTSSELTPAKELVNHLVMFGGTITFGKLTTNFPSTLKIYETVDEIDGTYILNLKNPFIEWLGKFAVYYSQAKKKSEHFVAATESLFRNHLSDTVFRCYMSDEKTVNNLVLYLEDFCNLPEMNKCPKAPTEILIDEMKRKHSYYRVQKRNRTSPNTTSE